ncbi:MAG: hypothetical protein [Microviridae sp.]|nr:MAG: hypothetical protein [Microviridae sp.]
MRKIVIAFYLFGAITIFGCSVVKESISSYEACKGDVECLQEMRAVGDATYSASKSVAGAAFPSIPECIAFLISNAAMFGFGVIKGRKKG